MSFQPSQYSLARPNAGGYSQNGWPASSVGSEIDLVWVPMPGTRQGGFNATREAAPALKAMAEWFNDNVEPIQTIYGWNYRTIAGSSKLSNHSSGTAIDINGCYRSDNGSLVSGCTLPYKERSIPSSTDTAITAKAVSLGLRWGGTYISNPDEMHFEVNVSPLELAKKVVVTASKVGMAVAATSVVVGGYAMLVLVAVARVRKKRKRREAG